MLALAPPGMPNCPSPLSQLQVLARLTDRRIAVEKELGALGESKKGTQDIFRHCRGFERAYSLLLQVRGREEAGGPSGGGGPCPKGVRCRLHTPRPTAEQHH